MSEDIRFCSVDGFFVGVSCPHCDRTGSEIVDGTLRRDVSGFLSGLLRHFGDEHGLHLPPNGWVEYSTVSEIVRDKYDISDPQLLSIIERDPKGRYELAEDKLRAVYGHSIEGISIDSTEKDVPDTLYHGTAPRFVESILDEGITPQSRNNVHLSVQFSDAVSVGQRHTHEDTVTVLHIDVNGMEQDGYSFSSSNGDIYMVDEVPTEYITSTDEVKVP